MCSLEQYIKAQQPEVYQRLSAIRTGSPKAAKDPRYSTREIEKLMRHDCYRRVGGAIKQVIHG